MNMCSMEYLQREKCPLMRPIQHDEKDTKKKMISDENEIFTKIETFALISKVSS